MSGNYPNSRASTAYKVLTLVNPGLLLPYLQSNDFHNIIQMVVVTKFFALPTGLRLLVAPRVRSFSVLHRPLPNYEGHVPLNTFERVALAAGSAVTSLINPRRGGMSTVSESC